GDPNCNVNDVSQPNFTVMQIAAAAAQSPSIHTFVIGFDASGGVNSIFLSRMAVAGKEPLKGCAGNKAYPRYYSATNQQPSTDAIKTILPAVTGGGEFANPSCDDSCFANGCPQGQVCTTDEQNTQPHCVNDPCGGMQCPSGTFCRMGGCVSP